MNKKKEGRQETIFDTKISIYCLILNDDMTFSRTKIPTQNKQTLFSPSMGWLVKIIKRLLNDLSFSYQ